MANREFRITRTHATWKPRVTAKDIPFFETNDTHDIFIGLGGQSVASYSGSDRSPVAELPYAALDAESIKAAHAPLLELSEVPESIKLNYRIDGGLNNNCIVFTWEINKPETYSLTWVCIKTFTGMQIKYLTPKKRPPLIFALADEDAFAYCDKIPCEECAFRCKSGFFAYVHISGLGIVKVPIDRVSMISFGKCDD